MMEVELGEKLCEVMRVGDEVSVVCIIGVGCDVIYFDVDGFMLLMYVVKYGYIVIVCKFLEVGVFWNVVFFFKFFVGDFFIFFIIEDSIVFCQFWKLVIICKVLGKFFDV